jgi:hypothetical protein
MLKSKIAMALAAAMVMAALYGCSSSSNNDGKVTQLEGQVGTLTDNAAAVLAKLRTTAEDLEITVPAGATAEAIADLIAGAGPDVVTTDPVEDAKAAAISKGIDRVMIDMDNGRIVVDGLTATDLGMGDEVGGEDDAADKKLDRSEMMPAELSGFDGTGAVFTQVDDADDPKVSDAVYVYSNKGGANDEVYNTFFALGAAVDSDARKALSGIAEPSAEGKTLNILTFQADMVSDNSDFFNSMSLPNTSGTFLVYEEDDDTDDSELMFAGMFRGVAGMYACDPGSDGCRAERSSDEKLSLPSGTWTFTATEPETTGGKVEVVGVIPDADYMTFGFWLRETAGDDGPSFMVETLYGTKDIYQAGTAETLVGDNSGKAEYSGAATGKFTRKEFSSDGTEAVVAGGQFTATAKLTAYFGTSPDIAMNDQNTLTGMITGFMAGDDLIDRTWGVTLNRQKFDNVNAEEPIVGTTEGDKDMMGAWEALFAGPDTKPAPTVDLPNATTPIQPGGVVGEFTGGFVNGNVVGAFGATKD